METSHWISIGNNLTCLSVMGRLDLWFNPIHEFGFCFITPENIRNKSNVKENNFLWLL